MAQVKIYGYRSALEGCRLVLSDAIHACLLEAFALPEGKRFHRFIALEADDFIHPADRTERYTILEIILFEGRSVEAKKKLMALLFEKLECLGISAQDLEIVLLESPKHNWGIRGLNASDLELSYSVRV